MKLLRVKEKILLTIINLFLVSCSTVCLSVIDGDTLRVKINGKIEIIRLVGIDAPETGMNKMLKFQERRTGLSSIEILGRGVLAKNKLEQLVSGKQCTVIKAYKNRERDAYGRILAYVEVDGNDVGEILLRERLVWLLENYKHDRKNRYLSIQ